MKVALVTDGIWPYAVGGMQRHSYSLCKHLAQSGVHVDLYYTVKNKTHEPDLSNVFTAEELRNIEPHFVNYPAGLYFPGHYIWKSYQYSRLIYQQLYKHLREYDVVYIQGFSGWGLLNKKKLLGFSPPPCIVNLHGLEMFQQASSFKGRLQQYLFKPFAKHQLLKADYVQSLGGALTSILLSLGISGSKIIECPNAIEQTWLTETIPHPHSPRSFTFIGRYESRKGIDQLNSVLKKLVNEGESFAMHFIGPIPESYQIKDDRIYYHGQLVDVSEIKRILDETDFLVVPSSAEGMPTVILEAMARGCAIIATKVGAVSEMVANDNGILMGRQHIQVLYDSMTNGLAIDDVALVRMKTASLKKVNEFFLWEKIITAMQSSFSKLKHDNSLVPCSTE
jgi:glycosyltransferase involved in cell wall biosynthesis